MPQVQVQPQHQPQQSRRHRRAYEQRGPDDEECDETPKDEEPTLASLDPTVAPAVETAAMAMATRFVTQRPQLKSEEAADSPLFRAYMDLRARILSAELKSPLLVLLGQDDKKRRDPAERAIREDEAEENLDRHLRAFFDAVLAPVVQTRETELVNAMHECFQRELQAQRALSDRQQQCVTLLTQQNERWEKESAHLKAKVDRRVAENNALRKEQYRQLLMLREIVQKQKHDPKALAVLNEAIATALTGAKHPKPASEEVESTETQQGKGPGRGWMALNAGAQTLRREKDKWEQRAKEAVGECKELREKIALLEEQCREYRASEPEPWFLAADNALAERQRIADAVGDAQCKWEDVGDALAELLNNDLLWTAVEQSARRGDKARVGRGLEAVLAQLDSWGPPPVIEDDDLNSDDEPSSPPSDMMGRRRSVFSDANRLVPCHSCNGAGYIHAELSSDSTSDTDSYLRKTLAQVLELKTQVEKATSKALALEGQLQLAHMQTARMQEKLDIAEAVKANGVDSCLQTDLDDDDDVDLDEIMRSAYNGDEPQSSLRRGRRNGQYEHLIVELKSSLADKEAGLTDSRQALDECQARLVSLQRAYQKQQEIHKQDLAKMRISLAFSLKHRNNKIEERQVAVKLLLKKFEREQQQPRKKRRRAFALSPIDDAAGEDEESDGAEASDEDGGEDSVELASLEVGATGNSSDKRDVERAELMAKRYAEDISRVCKEHDEQQQRLKQAETDFAVEEEKRKRTNSISQGSIIVNMASHPRDLFKALSTAQGEILALRRASQRSSTLQTDRLLTLTTHLGHMSEELCMLRKRNMTEVEYWKLECEKLQNSNKALTAEQQLAQQQLEAALAQRTENTGPSSMKSCAMCQKHKERLMQISTQLLEEHRAKRPGSGGEKSSRGNASTVTSTTELTDTDRRNLSAVLLDLESLYSGMTLAKQDLARNFLASHLGNDFGGGFRKSSRPSSGPKTSTNASRSDAGMPNNPPEEARSSRPSPERSRSPRKSVRSADAAKAKRQSKNSSEVSVEVQEEGKDQKSDCAPRNEELAMSNLEGVAVEDVTAIVPELQTGSDVREESEEQLGGNLSGVMGRRRTLVEEILDGGGLSLSKYGLVKTELSPEQVALPRDSQNSGSNADNLGDVTKSFNSKDSATAITEARNDATVTPVLCTEIHRATPYQAQDGPKTALLINTNDIEREPEVIQQLSLLIKQGNSAREYLAITNWEILMCRIRRLRDQQRLDQMTYESSKLHVSGDYLDEPTFAIIQRTMQKLVQLRESFLEATLSTRERCRKDCQKAQAHLIHSVAMILENLSRKGKASTGPGGVSYPEPFIPPRKSPVHRPLYPSAHVNLLQLPPTQQIPTLTFPVITSTTQRREATHSAPEYRHVRTSNDKQLLRGDTPDSTERSESSPKKRNSAQSRLINSAEPGEGLPFSLSRADVVSLKASAPIPTSSQLRERSEQARRGNTGWEGAEAPSAAFAHLSCQRRPARPHSSPVGSRLVSPRMRDVVSLAASKPELPTAKSGIDDYRREPRQPEQTRAPIVMKIPRPESAS